MKKRIFVYLIIILVQFIVIYSLISSYTYKHAYTTKPITSFTIPELKNSDVWTTAMTASDTMLYTYTCKWTKTPYNYTSTSYAYNFKGEKDAAFHLPDDSYYSYLTSEFGFLRGRNQLYLNDNTKPALDFFSPQGKLINRQSIVMLNSVAEFHDDLYYTILSNKDAHTWFLYKKQPGKKMELIKTVKSLKKEKRNAWFLIMVDSNGNNKLSMAEVKRKEILVNIYSDDQEKTFSIRRHPGNDNPWYFYLWDWQKISNMWKAVLLEVTGKFEKPDAPWNMFCGDNYIVLTTFKGNKQQTLDTNKIYNLHGRCLGVLNCKNDPGSRLVDISGDKLIFLNRSTGRVSIEQIKVK